MAGCSPALENSPPYHAVRKPVNRLTDKELRPAKRRRIGLRDSIRRASAVRILLDYRPALRQRTGVGEYVHELARALVASAPTGESLSLFSASWRDRLSPAAVPGAAVIDRRVPVRVLNLLWHRFEWPTAERLTGQTFDVAQSSHPLLVPTARAAQIATIYDLDFLDHPERTRQEIRRDYPSLAPSHARRADQIVVISRYTAQQVQTRLQVAAERISVAFPGAPDWPPRRTEPADGCVLFLGTLGPRKNAGMLLEAYERVLARLPAAPPLVLAGQATPDASFLSVRAAAPPLAGHVELPGYVPSDQRLTLYRRALVFVLPSHAEGFGMPAVEAMVCGVPVVAAKRGALPEAVGGAGWLVDPDDPGALADALVTVLSDAGLRDRMREEGWQQARRFQWTETAARVREAWALAVEHRKRRG
jgi:glycosyltransferase involved in cell wall biosynthesis